MSSSVFHRLIRHALWNVSRGQTYRTVNLHSLFRHILRLPPRRYQPLFFIPAISLWKSKPDPKVEFGKLLDRADRLYDEYQLDVLWRLLKDCYDPENIEVVWRYARVTCEMGKVCKDANRRQELFEEAMQLVEHALTLPDAASCSAAHKWYAIVLNYVSELRGTKEQLVRSYEVKEHFQKAVELNPTDATSWHLLGLWTFTFADLPWYQKKVAAAVFASPPETTYEEALEYFEKAESIDAGFYSQNLLMLGKTFLRLGNKIKAREYLEKTVRYAVSTQDDINAHHEAEKLLKSC